ncbi:disulfide isomerase DsbC N-terminal domain-containing protein [Imhoffiella purpurea]|uniref:Thiol:disulfide interchange protein n=1 Tax=Imhoffiella purpurea TaxID=1249627 RepID=W9V6U0_9GAMM|nr:thioredoxin fold domain-containing protein [Imhoffiella purpurea]EXJ15119.1 Thiol:disulfide interchange protein DsbC [Imhoffiella purpurea]
MIRFGDFALLAGSLALVSSLAVASPEDDIRASLKKVIPEVEITNIQPSPVKGLYEVMAGNELMYVTGDGRYYINGRIVDITTQPVPTDLTEQRLAAVRKKLVDEIGEDRMVIFGSPEAKHTVTVFTDIECGYCRKLHNQIADYEKEGIRVRYLFFPRAGKDSPAYDEAVSVWCAGDADARRAAMTKAKSGEQIPAKTCDNPVDAHMALGRDLGLRGTPAILTEDGQLIPGYVPPKRLAAELDGSSGS